MNTLPSCTIEVVRTRWEQGSVHAPCCVVVLVVLVVLAL